MEGTSASPRRRSRRSAGVDSSKAVCLLCRQRKVKCGKQRPCCDHCLKLGAPCHYVMEQKKPGLRAGYVSELERRLILLEQEVRQLKAEKQDKPGIVPSGALSSPALLPQLSSASPENGKIDIDTPQTGDTLLLPHLARHTARFPDQFDPLSPDTLTALCTNWFDEFQSWFPILHKPTILRDLNNKDYLHSANSAIVFKAMAAVVLPSWNHSTGLTSQQRYDMSLDLRDQVLTEATGKLSLRSMQAVLILVILDWGSDRLSEAWNLTALSKRMSTQLGLRDLTAYQCKNFSQRATAAPRVLPLPSGLVDREEKIRAFWTAEFLDISSTIGVRWNLGLSRPEGAGIMPSNKAIWTLPEFEVPLYSDMSSSFALYISLCTKGLWYVHRFHQMHFDLTCVEDRTRRDVECRAVDDRLCAWRHDFAATAFELMGHKDSRANGVDPNTIMVRCTFNTAVIALHQPLTAISPVERNDSSYRAIQRCIDGADDIAMAFRDMAGSNFLRTTPYLILCLFIAARFYIVYARNYSARISPHLKVLLDALNVYERRWALARRLSKVVQTALHEHQIHSAMISLPARFYDLQYSSMDIDEALRTWAERMELWFNLPQIEASVSEAREP